MSVAKHYTEPELLQALFDGQSKALEELMRMYFPVLNNFARQMVTDTALAEDIAEEAFIQLWKRHTAFDSLFSIRKFLWVTARRDCLDAIRNKGTRLRHLDQLSKTITPEDSATALNDMIRAEVLAEIYAAIRDLPEKMQRVFVLSYIDGYKNHEIAAQLQLSEQTVRNQKSRALEILRLKFKDNEAMLTLVSWLISCHHL